MVRFLTLEDIKNEYATLAYKVSDLSENVKQGLNPVDPEQWAYDYVRPLENGWEWLFKDMVTNQPKTYAELAKRSPSIVVGERFWKDRVDPLEIHWSIKGFLKIDNRYIVFHPTRHG